MGERTRFPSAAAIAKAEKLTREPFLHPGETKEDALAEGTPRRRALDAALAEVKQGLSIPSLEWRREWSLMLGLERVLSDEEPRLADGTLLNPHQVDALSGTLTALLATSLGGVAEAAAVGSPPPSSAAANASRPRSRTSAAARRPAASKVATLAEADAATDPEDPPASGETAAAADPAPSDERVTEDLPEVDDLDLEGDELELELDDDADEETDVEDDDDLDDEDLGDDADLRAEVGIDDEDDTADEDDAEEDEDSDDEPQDFTEDDAGLDSDAVVDAEDPGADRRFWFEHATGAGKTVAAMGFVEASRTGGVLILTHRRNLVDQFIDEIKTRGYRDRLCPPLLIGEDAANGPVTVETYQWFVRNAGKISDAYTVVICDEAHTALGEKTSAQIRSWDKPVWIGMTATGALIARHVTDLFPTQTSRFDLAQAARRGVIAPLRCIRIPPGPGVRTIAKVPLRRGEVDTEFDQEMLAELLDQTPFNLAIADLYKTRFNGLPGVVYAAGVKHAYNVAESFREFGINAQAVSGETPKRELARILADYEAGKVDVLVNAQLLAEGWNSPRATICMHLAPTASKRIYQQRVGRVTRRHLGKEAGIVVDFVHPATKHDDPVVTLHSLLDRDVYRGGAIVVGPVRRGRGRRVRVERRVLPVTPDPTRRAEVFERELWRIAVENLDWGEQRVWAQLAGARVQPNGWRRAKAMLHFDREGELRRLFLLTTLQRNRSAQLHLRALGEIAAIRDAEAFDSAIDLMGTWPKDERREGVKIMLLALAERRIGRRDQANAWIWRMAEYTRDVHEEYAAQRWPETKRLLGLLVNSSGSAHARNARRLVHATRTQDRRLSAALLAAALAHTPEAEEALRGARTRMARKPAALARELLRNFPKGKKSASKRRRKAKPAAEESTAVLTGAGTSGMSDAEAPIKVVASEGAEVTVDSPVGADAPTGDRSRSRRRGRRRVTINEDAAAADAATTETTGPTGDDAVTPDASSANRPAAPARPTPEAPTAPEAVKLPARRRGRTRPATKTVTTPSATIAAAQAAAAAIAAAEEAAGQPVSAETPAPVKRTRRRVAKAAEPEAASSGAEAVATPSETKAPAVATPPEAAAPAVVSPSETPAPEAEAPVPAKRTRRRATKAAEPEAPTSAPDAVETPPASETAAPAKPTRRRTTKATAAETAAVSTEPTAAPAEGAAGAEGPAAAEGPATAEPADTAAATPVKRTRRRAAGTAAAAAEATDDTAAADATPPAKPTRRRTTKAAAVAEVDAVPAETTPAAEPAPVKRTRTRTRAAAGDTPAAEASTTTEAPTTPDAKPAAKRTTRSRAKVADAAETPTRPRTTRKRAAAAEQLSLDGDAGDAPTPETAELDAA